MKKKHRDSQKRKYFEDAVYFVTCKTEGGYPFFKERIFCELFIENLRICKQLKCFYLYAWVLIYNHFHLLIKPNDEFDVSKIMKSLKENVSCDINRISRNEGATPASRLREIYQNKFDIFDCQSRFIKKHPNQNPCPRFQWQKSYHDHYIRNDGDFDCYMDYIIWNPVKHKMSDNWPYVFTNPNYEDLIDEPI